MYIHVYITFTYYSYTKSVLLPYILGVPYVIRIEQYKLLSTRDNSQNDTQYIPAESHGRDLS
jgi:hypothetical protein